MESFFELLTSIPGSVYNREKKIVDDVPEDSDIKKLFKLYSAMFDRMNAIIGNVSDEFTGKELPQLAHLKWISLHSGVVLDQIGEIVKEPRQGNTDAKYKKNLKIAIKRNTSNGSLPTVSEITHLISETMDYSIEECHTEDKGTKLDAQLGVKTFPKLNAAWVFNPYLPQPAVFKVTMPDSTDNATIDYLKNTLNEVKAAGVQAIVTKLTPV